MQSLSAHLREPDDHGRLAFHPDCVICRERLVGALPSGIISRRTQALLAGGVLAISTAAPGAALAGEPDRQQEGAGAPDRIAGGDPPGRTGFDPGGDSTGLPLDDPASPRMQPPPSPDTDEGGAHDDVAAPDPGAPIVDAGDEPAPTAQQPLPAQAQPAPPSPHEQPAAPSEPLESAPAPEAPAAAPTPPSGEHTSPRTHGKQETGSAEPRKKEVAPSGATPRSIPAVEPAQGPPAGSTAIAPGAGGAEPGDRFHVVDSGESLWSIAGDLLGDEAPAARIAREVSRLWELNDDRIGTGDPDLLMIGTRLRLR